MFLIFPISLPPSYRKQTLSVVLPLLRGLAVAAAERVFIEPHEKCKRSNEDTNDSLHKEIEVVSQAFFFPFHRSLVVALPAVRAKKLGTPGEKKEIGSNERHIKHDILYAST
jgi:hypothetical protein